MAERLIKESTKRIKSFWKAQQKAGKTAPKTGESWISRWKMEKWKIDISEAQTFVFLFSLSRMENKFGFGVILPLTSKEHEADMLKER